MAGEIQIMIPQYGELNRIYSDFIVSHTFSFDRQKFITDFYKQYNDTKAFEAAILELVLDKPKEQYTLILNSLRTEIEKNILIYEKYPLFDDGNIRQQKKSKPRRSMNAARLNMRRKKKDWTGFMNWNGWQGRKLSNILKTVAEIFIN